jgi:hypothetical protein
MERDDGVLDAIDMPATGPDLFLAEVTSLLGRRVVIESEVDGRITLTTHAPAE